MLHTYIYATCMEGKRYAYCRRDIPWMSHACFMCGMLVQLVDSDNLSCFVRLPMHST